MSQMRVLVVGAYAPSLVNFRGPLLAEMVARGHEVHAAAYGLSNTATSASLRNIGVTAHDVPLERTGLDPLADLRSLFALMRLMRRIRPEIVLCYTIKPVIWGMLAAAAVQVPRRHALITGLGYAFGDDARGKARIVRGLARVLYARALARADTVFFQNPDDAALFRALRLVAPDTRQVTVNGSGVDLAHFAPAGFPDGPPVFLMIARLLGAKGIREYAQAARAVRLTTHPHARFHLVGGFDPGPDAVAPQEVAAWQEEGIIVWRGALDDVRPAISAAHVYVLPSYREGTPRTVLEAMAMGRPVITTDVAGCRETVVDGHNGFLVPVREVEPLAAAMRRFLDDPGLAEPMGRRSVKIAEEKYDVYKINGEMLREMGL